MFTYCNNNPINLVDTDGQFGVGFLCAIGAIAGGLINYAGQVMSNYRDGKSGTEAWTDVNVGEVASAAFSGALAAIPGSGALVDIADTVGSVVIEHGVNALVAGKPFELKKVGKEIVSDFIVNTVVGDIIPKKSVPRYIRDIKEEAVEAGIKGTKKLTKFLNFKQATNIVINSFNADTSARIKDMVFG